MRLGRSVAALSVVAALAAFTALPAPPAYADTTTDTYIVQLKPGVSADAMTGRLMGASARVIHKVFQGGIVKLTAVQAQALAANPNVKSVHKDAIVKATGIENNAPWDLDVLDNPTASEDQTYSYPNNGSGVTVYVIDSGILQTHSEFRGATIASGYDFVDGDTTPQDCNGHGTSVSSLIAGFTLGASKGVTLVPLKVLGCDGSGNESNIISAADWIATHRTAGSPAVANLSLGAPASGGPNPMETALQGLIYSGVTVVAAAGNGDANGHGLDACTESPARLADAITVGAVNRAHAQSSFSNYGTCVDLYAPGESVVVANTTNDYAMAQGAGTSFSAPLVAAAAAQVLNDHPTWTPAQVAGDLRTRATPGLITGLDATSPNLMLNISGTGAAPVPPTSPSAYEPFVKASYQNFLGRQPTPSELAYHSTALSAGTESRTAYLSWLSTSDEWLNAIVTKMYVDTLQRQPDAAGLAGWVGALRNGSWSVAQVASYFYASDEYYQNFAGNAPTPWVTQLYQKLLNRDPDAPGLAQWVQQTNDPRYGRVWVATMFYQSTESRMRRVEALYLSLLFREPDSTGWPYWTNTVWTTGDLVLATQIAGSQEYWDKAQARY